MKAIIKNKLNQIKQKYIKDGFVIVGVLGSYARDEQNQTSDIDILYSVDKEFVKKYSGFYGAVFLEKVKDDIKEMLGISNIDFIPSDTNNDTIKKVIQQELVYV